MSSRAHRLVHAINITPFDWADQSFEPPAEAVDRFAEYAPPDRRQPAPLALAPAPEPQVDMAALERDAFQKGYAQGERAGAEAAAARGEMMVRRLAQTIEELGALRKDMMHKSERQLVQLAVAIAHRVIQREITLDKELLVAMARVALDRLGDVSTATIRLHPEDFSATTHARGAALSSELVRVVADPIVNRGGCLVESDFGMINLSIPAQIDEITNALLGAGEDMAFDEELVRIAS